jgi:hypothetical protein
LLETRENVYEDSLNEGKRFWPSVHEPYRVL